MPRPLGHAASCLAALVLAACTSADPTLKDPPAWTASTAAPFSGSVVTFHSTAVKGLSTAATVQFGAVTLSVTRVDDSTATVTLPVTLSGTFAPVLTSDTTRITLPNMHVYGFRDAKVWGSDNAGLTWDVYPLTVRGKAEILGNHFLLNGGGLADGMTIVDLDGGTIQNIAIGQSLTHGPGPSENDSVVVYERYEGWTELWNVARPVPIRVDSIATYNAGLLQVARVGPQCWLGVFQHGGGFYCFDGTNSAFTSGDASGMVMSPAHNRVMVRGGGSSAQRPVFAAPAGTIAFSLPENLRGAEGMAFSADGQLLGIGVGAGSAGHVSIVNANDGTMLGDTTISDPTFSVAMDDSRPLMYAGVTRTGSNSPAILVFQRNPMHLVGRIELPATAPMCAPNGCSGGMIFQYRNTLYMWWSFQGSAQSWRFDLPTP